MRYLLILFAALLTALPANASEDFSYAAFERIPILDNGRIKPLGAYAKLRLESYNGHNTIEGQSASAWLAETLFDPSTAIARKIFYIQSDDLKTRLELNLNEDHFNLADLQSGLEKTRSEIPALLQKTDDELTKGQKDLLALHEKTLQHGQMLRSFSMLLPLNIEIPEKYSLPPSAPVNFLNLQTLEPEILNDLKSIIERKGQNPENYNDAEKQIALLAFQIQKIRSGSQNGAAINTEFQVFPSDKKALQSPWSSTKEKTQSTDYNFQLWLKLANSYRASNAEEWNKTTQTIAKKAEQYASPTRMKAELLYQKLKPYTLTMSLYALSIALLCAALIRPSITIIKPLAIIAGYSALIIHSGAIIARIYILARPPVGTLYESLIFVSLICAAIALLASIKNKSTAFPLIGQIAALFMLCVSPVLLQTNDSLELLVAVLNTNFWLATHVICITAGYGVCILAASTAHVYLAARILNKPKDLLRKLFKLTYKTTLAALLLTAVGTVLGGIWADQSWGRFWGWDPKENGALLIVLWIIWALHAKLSGNVKELGFTAIIALLNVIVALSWFGVNLLGVGLHSYGFTSGLASGLFTFCAIGVVTVSALYWGAKRQHKRQTA